MKWIGWLRGLRGLRSSLAALGLAAAGCTTTAPVAGSSARPALWEVADSDTRIYLFGTIHMLPADYRWRTPLIERAVAGSDTLVVETIVDTAQPQALAAELARLGLREGLPPIADRVSPELEGALDQAIARSGMPRAAFDRMETWAAAFTLLGSQFRSMGLGGAEGVEAVLRRSFEAERKPVAQLETNVEQLTVFDTLSESAQRMLLEGAIEKREAMRGQFDAMLASWASGDTQGIARSFNEEFASSPELLDALIVRRNANWAGWIERRMAQPGSALMAVGAGHLAGEASVQTLLERRGYRVRRLQ